MLTLLQKKIESSFNHFEVLFYFLKIESINLNQISFIPLFSIFQSNKLFNRIYEIREKIIIEVNIINIPNFVELIKLYYEQENSLDSNNICFLTERLLNLFLKKILKKKLMHIPEYKSLTKIQHELTKKNIVSNLVKNKCYFIECNTYIKPHNIIGFNTYIGYNLQKKIDIISVNYKYRKTNQKIIEIYEDYLNSCISNINLSLKNVDLIPSYNIGKYVIGKIGSVE
ncbi:hypothetical protein [Francisella frigiditurris]|uniref:Uncharacterized protein n=1 Tax=Francisella frigiditurris TaxID=1542390 RepID=A0A1J0KT13_9GAMM|nr:hypothetical protein [Francisella frigiditurris]APC96897.1 hypothetical protein KX01_1287 [Francisella frigiditurris]